MNETPIALALIALIGTLAAGFFKLLGDTNKALTKLADSGENQAKQMGKVAQATKQGADEAKQRNGHLGEQNLQIIKLVKSQGELIVDSIENVAEQHVKKQVVDNQEVKVETVDKVIRSKK